MASADVVPTTASAVAARPDLKFMGWCGLWGLASPLNTPSPRSMINVMSSLTHCCDLGHSAFSNKQTYCYDMIWLHRIDAF